MNEEDQGASAAPADRVTDATHGASKLSPPFGSVPTSAGVVPATPADRDAAADVIKAYRGRKNHDWEGRVRRGEADDGVMVQTFVLHRIAAAGPLAEVLQEARRYVGYCHRTSADTAFSGEARATLSKIDAAIAQATGAA